MKTILFPDYIPDDTLDDDTPDNDNSISGINDDEIYNYDNNKNNDGDHLNDNNDAGNDSNYDNDNDDQTIVIFQTVHFLFTHVYLHI